MDALQVVSNNYELLQNQKEFPEPIHKLPPLGPIVVWSCSPWRARGGGAARPPASAAAAATARVRGGEAGRRRRGRRGGRASASASRAAAAASAAALASRGGFANRDVGIDRNFADMGNPVAVGCDIQWQW